MRKLALAALVIPEPEVHTPRWAFTMQIGAFVTGLQREP